VRPNLLSLGVFSAALVLIGCSSHTGTSLAPAVMPDTSQTRTTSSLDAYPITLEAFPISLGAFPISAQAFPVCNAAQYDGKDQNAGCGAWRRSGLAGIPAGTPADQVPGYQPVHLQGAYGVTGEAASIGSGRTVAIVSAFIDKTIEKDLAVYRATFGLPPCTIASGCLTIDQPNGHQPMPDSTWGEETALDTEMVSAICPNCKIVVVEASSAKLQDLAAAVDDAASYHPNAISNSYAAPEGTGDKKLKGLAGHYQKPNIAIIAGAGDSGYGVNFPASAPGVIAVGGTTLTQRADGTFAHQEVWSGSGSGCSALFAKPKWQTDTGCKNRTVNDVAVVADPATGVAGYSSYAHGWNVYGGTSIAAPIVAAMFALSGAPEGLSDGSGIYSAPDGSFAWIDGANGLCLPAYLCTAAGKSYNGPAGVGVPYGLSGFNPAQPVKKPPKPKPPKP
jgi:subtilase family serine protease